MKSWFVWQKRRGLDLRPDRAAIGLAILLGLLALWGIFAPAGARW